MGEYIVEYNQHLQGTADRYGPTFSEYMVQVERKKMISLSGKTKRESKAMVQIGNLISSRKRDLLLRLKGGMQFQLLEKPKIMLKFYNRLQKCSRYSSKEKTEFFYPLNCEWLFRIVLTKEYGETLAPHSEPNPIRPCSFSSCFPWNIYMPCGQTWVGVTSGRTRHHMEKSSGAAPESHPNPRNSILIRPG